MRERERGREGERERENERDGDESERLRWSIEDVSAELAAQKLALASAEVAAARASELEERLVEHKTTAREMAEETEELRWICQERSEELAAAAREAPAARASELEGHLAQRRGMVRKEEHYGARQEAKRSRAAWQCDAEQLQTSNSGDTPVFMERLLERFAAGSTVAGGFAPEDEHLVEETRRIVAQLGSLPQGGDADRQVASIFRKQFARLQESIEAARHDGGSGHTLT